MKKLLVVIIILAVAILMTQTVPDKKAHKRAMMKAVSEYVDEKAEENGFHSNVITNIGKSVVNFAAATAIDAKLKVHNYYLFNTTSVRLKGEDKLLSIGAFGHVFTFDKKMLREALEEGDDQEE